MSKDKVLGVAERLENGDYGAILASIKSRINHKRMELNSIEELVDQLFPFDVMDQEVRVSVDTLLQLYDLVGLRVD